MALTRKLLTAMGIEQEKIDEIITAHAATVDALKEERDAAKQEAQSYKDDAKKLPEVQNELNELKESQGNNVYEEKYNSMKAERDNLQSEFDKYKADIQAKDIRRSKENILKSLLREANISDKRIDKIIKVSDIDAIELDKDGNAKDVDTLKKSIQEEWGDFIVNNSQQGAKVAEPNSTNNSVPKGQSRAAKIAAQYHNNLYGETKEGN